nr:ATP-dependent Clp protease proteolytic subunit [Arcanobacterium pluranimalium]
MEIRSSPFIRTAKSALNLEGVYVTNVPQLAGEGQQGFGLGDSIYNRLLKERIIWLGDQVRDENANMICAQLLLLAAEDPDKDIYLYINSPGGSVTAGMAIFDTMEYIKPDVATVGMGLAASMGQFLLSAGAKGKRYITPHTRVLMHQPLGGAGGTATEIRINADLILQMKQELSELNAKHTGKTVEQILEDSDRDHWFTATEAVEYGFADHIITNSSSVIGGGGVDRTIPVNEEAN